MSCLWITAEPPDRDQGGGNIRQAHLLEALGPRLATHVLMTGHLTDDRTRRAVAGVTELPEHPVRPPRTRLERRARSLWTALGPGAAPEVAAAAGARRELARALQAMAGDFAVAVVNHQALAPLLPRQRAARWVFHPHNVSARRAAQQLATTRGRRQRWLLRREMAKAHHLEQWAVRSYDALLTVSAEDARALGAGTATPVIVAPNGVDLDRFQPAPLGREPRLVFTGTMNYLPNVDAMQWFCTEVLPLVRAQVPGTTLDIVGRHPVADVEALGNLDGVHVHGGVPQIVPWLHDARVVVVPLRLGTGTRLKALEAMACARPLVATGIGLEGLGVRDGVHALVRETPAAMADAIVLLLRDDEAASGIGAAGRALVEASFDWKRIGAALADAVVAVARAGSPGARPR